MTSLLLLSTVLAHASSHREAPAITHDPAADLTDFYAFVSPEDPSKVVFVLNVNPYTDPGGGPNYASFDDSATYSINIDNEGDGAQDITFNFRFDTTYQLPGDFLYNVGAIDNPANLNMVQTYEITRADDGPGGSPSTRLLAAGGGTVAPANPGTQSDPNMGYDPYSPAGGGITHQYIESFTNAGHVYRAFAGMRQDPFYIDLGRTFDLLNLAGNDPGANTNTLLGKDVTSIAFEVDSALLTKDGLPVSASNSVIAAWATVSRKHHLIRSHDGAEANYEYGGGVQVSRLGMPLVNEVVIPIMDKDRFNAAAPADDGQFLGYVTDPILMPYLTAVLGVPDPGCADVFAGINLGCREDLVEVFLTGVPGLNQPAGWSLGAPIPGENGKVFGAFEALRLDMANPTSGFPNGRLLQDDVVDVGLSVVAGLFINGATLSDGVDSTGLTYLNEFPFVGDPWQGDNHPVGYHDF